jgi:hypothetical protein
LWLFGDLPSEALDAREYRVGLRLALRVVRESDSGKPAKYLRGIFLVDVLRQQVKRIQLQFRAVIVEKITFGLSSSFGVTKPSTSL